MCTIAPKPTFVPLIDKKEPPINEPYAEIRLSKEKGEEIEIGRFINLLKYQIFFF